MERAAEPVWERGPLGNEASAFEEAGGYGDTGEPDDSGSQEAAEDPPSSDGDPEEEAPTKAAFSLSEAQAAVVEHLDGPALVVSGAGSGKTSVVTRRIVRLCERGVSPERILGLTFTRKAAREMRERIAKTLPSAAKKVTLITFHSLGLLLCREFPALIGRRPRFGIWDDKVMMSEMRRILRELTGADDGPGEDEETAHLDLAFVPGDPRPSPASCLKYLEVNKEAGYSELVFDDPTFHDRSVQKAAVLQYERTKLSANVLDYTDLVWSAFRLLSTHAEVREIVQKRWTHLMVDEYQDTNDLQERLLQLLIGPSKNLVVVGDEDQAIYAFRGSNADYIRSFPDRYEGAKVYPLGQNYRSVQAVVRPAANVITFNENRRSDKKIWTENPEGDPVRIEENSSQQEEAVFVARTLMSSIASGRRPEHHAVLVRTRRQFLLIQSALRAHKVAYATVGGIDHMQRPDVRRVLSWFRLFVCPLDISAGAQVLGHWPKLGAATVQQWSMLVATSEGPVFARLDQLHKQKGLGTHTKKGQSLIRLQQTWVDFAHRIHVSGVSIRDHAKWLYAVTGIDQEIDELLEEDVDQKARDEGQARMELRQAFLETCPDDKFSGSGLLSILAFLDSFMLHASDSRREGDKVVLSTIHGSKGLEWPVVFVVGVVEGLLPHSSNVVRNMDDTWEAKLKPDEVEEERRLMYVAMTRAREVLYLSWFKLLSWPRPDGEKKCSRSRFLNQLEETRAERDEREAVEIRESMIVRYKPDPADTPFHAEEKRALLYSVEQAFGRRDLPELRHLSQHDDVPAVKADVGKFSIRSVKASMKGPESPSAPLLPKISLRRKP